MSTIQTVEVPKAIQLHRNNKGVSALEGHSAYGAQVLDRFAPNLAMSSTNIHNPLKCAWFHSKSRDYWYCYFCVTSFYILRVVQHMRAIQPVDNQGNSAAQNNNTASAFEVIQPVGIPRQFSSTRTGVLQLLIACGGAASNIKEASSNSAQ